MDGSPEHEGTQEGGRIQLGVHTTGVHQVNGKLLDRTASNTSRWA